MSATNRLHGASWRLPNAQAGTTAIEVALLSVIFFTLVFGAIEISRLMYVFNTLQEVTRRAAAAAVNVDPRDSDAISKIKQNAVFRDSPGQLALGAPVTDNYVRIDYLALARASDGSMSMVAVPQSSWPTCPGQNRQTCMSNPNSANCIRFVRVRVCDPANSGACDAVPSTLMIPTINFTVNLPRATTIVPAESLGFMPGMAPSP
jgi:Flp pilus assembly protein TadG